eukprot:CAMPEP_0118952800 /NCGR_PEP_ID=MMETSP1169-20130426/55490_1 /TAXON_ID=36882 /ORGANISM="Pyramimonas obovata, Strain CCMP722" /LENGTH=324 /DNA_ID=CAMNT_0006900131 /DNA_START=99 /DNA_END=1070 /DNA_ORIENTATION=+
MAAVQSCSPRGQARGTKESALASHLHRFGQESKLLSILPRVKDVRGGDLLVRQRAAATLAHSFKTHSSNRRQRAHSVLAPGKFENAGHQALSSRLSANAQSFNSRGGAVGGYASYNWSFRSAHSSFSETSRMSQVRAQSQDAVMPTGSAEQAASETVSASQQDMVGALPVEPTRTLIVGVGKRGCTVVDELLASGSYPHTEFWKMGVDAKMLNASSVDNTILLPAGNIDEAEAVRLCEPLLNRLKDVEAVVCILAGTDGTWKGAPHAPCGMAANVVLKQANEDGTLAGAVVAQPFSFEGPRRVRASREAVETLQGVTHITATVD